MNKEEQILKLIEDKNGVITTKEIVEKDISRVFLTRLVNKGELERVKKCLYVFLLLGEMNILNLYESVPSTYHITVNREYNGSLKNYTNVKLHFVKNEMFEIGKITIKSPQNQNISCYNTERCICDLLRDKDNQDVETIKYSITEYLNNKNERALPKLMEYAKKFNVEDDISKYLEG